MKTKLFKVAATSLFAALFVTSANAQSIKYPKSHFGIRVGITSTAVSVTDDVVKNAKGRLFPTGGLAWDFRIASIPLYMETGAYLVDRTVEWESQWDAMNETKLGAQVPLLLSYHHYIADDVAIQPFIGAYGAFASDLVEMGLRFGAGINYKRFYVNAGYDLCLFSDNSLYKVNAFFTTIGFNFGGRR